MVQDLNGVVVEIQPCQIRRVFEQVSVQGVDLVVSEVQCFQSDTVVDAILVWALEDLPSEDFA